MEANHIAQLNLARLVAPLEAPEIAEFVAALDPVNALADAAPGFVWRLQDDHGDATSFRPFDDDTLLVNLSVWESIEALADFTYRTAHRDVLHRRGEWFAKLGDAHLVLWWVPAGHVPSLEESKDRLDRLRAQGPTPDAFTFRTRFPAPS